MLKTSRPSFRRSKLAADAASAVSHNKSVTPLTNVVRRLGFKQGGKKSSPKFEFQEVKENATPADLLHRPNLMQKVAARVYSQMGLSIQTHETARAALIWFNQFMETLINQEEREIANRLATRMGDLVEEFRRIRIDKITLTEDLELALTSAKRDTHLARMKKAAEEESTKRKKGINSLMPEEPTPETADPLIAIDPALLIKNAETEIRAAEQAKSAKKPKNKEATEENDF
jgi:hypothetical protein